MLFSLLEHGLQTKCGKSPRGNDFFVQRFGHGEKTAFPFTEQVITVISVTYGCTNPT